MTYSTAYWYDDYNRIERKGESSMDPLWIMIGIPLTALLVFSGVRQFQKHKRASDEVDDEEQNQN